MGLKRISPTSREEWLEARKIQGIGASEASAIVGLSPWMSKNDLWELKTGRRVAKDLSANAAVRQGIAMESAIRTVFEARHPELEVEYHQFDILFQEERPWLFATLDGELTERFRRMGGVLVGFNGSDEDLEDVEIVKLKYPLEIKTSTPRGRSDWEKWANGKIPDYYYIQILHQMLATGWEKSFLTAFLYGREDITIKEYEFLRKDCQADLDWLLREETAFYNAVVTDQKPLNFTFFV